MIQHTKKKNGALRTIMCAANKTNDRATKIDQNSRPNDRATLPAVVVMALLSQSQLTGAQDTQLPRE